MTRNESLPGLHRSLFWLVLLLLCSLSSSSRAATLPSGFTETLVASGVPVPTAMAFAPDGRLFVTQQNGKLRVIKNGTLLATPFVTLTVDANLEEREAKLRSHKTNRHALKSLIEHRRPKK